MLIFKVKTTISLITLTALLFCNLSFAETEKKSVIIKHVKGEAGIPLPDPKKVERLFRENMPKFSEEKTKALIKEHYFKLMEEQYQEDTKPYKLNECSSNKTTKTRHKGVKKVSPGKASVDILFIQEEQVPIDPNEVFGSSVMIKRYNSHKNYGVHQAARGLKVECLPTRFRITPSYSYTDQGLNALKNYSQDHHRSGKLHPMYQNR